MVSNLARCVLPTVRTYTAPRERRRNEKNPPGASRRALAEANVRPDIIAVKLNRTVHAAKARAKEPEIIFRDIDLDEVWALAARFQAYDDLFSHRTWRYRATTIKQAATSHVGAPRSSARGRSRPRTR
jgi:hypothetical protein